MKFSEWTIVAAFVAALICLTSIASVPIGGPDKDAASAAAIRYFVGSMVARVAVTKPSRYPEMVICLTTRTSLDVSAISRKLSHTIIKTVPVDACTSKTVEGNFGMFTALTTYFDQNGQEAGHLSVQRVLCPTRRKCEVDIDMRGSGYRLWLELIDNEWKVEKSQMRWVV